MTKLEQPRLSPRGRKVKVLATLGPASRSPEMLRKLLRAGADAFRVNMSHGEHADHAAAIAAIRALEKEYNRPIAILADLQGPKLRVGTFKDGKAVIRHSGHFTLDRNPAPGDETRVELPHPELFPVLHKGQRLLINDGKIRLRVIKAEPDAILCSAEVGGVISDRKGLNVPDAVVPVPALTEKDRRDLAFAVEQGADWIALSFVQRPEDVADARRLIAGRAAVMVKVEKPAALDRLDEIIDLADGIMIARGDLGVEMPPEEVPGLQKRMIRAARGAGKPVVVATQMLESMIRSPAPTRAEASDVATAVYDGADALMLSAETAAGEYPIEAVALMDRIIARVERDPLYRSYVDAYHAEAQHTAPDAITLAAREVASTMRAAAIVTYTTTGSTALRAARERPDRPILSLITQTTTARRLALVWGLHTVVCEDAHDVDEMTERACRLARESGVADAGAAIVITAGVPFGTPGSTNLLRIAWVS
jgi:pyruvate kinase